MATLPLLKLPALCMLTALQPALRAAPPARLRCEWLAQPTCVETASPRFSWEVQDPRLGAAQSAYEIHVATTPVQARAAAPDVWSSGKVASGETMNVAYAGPALASGARYYWTVSTWDAADMPTEWAAPAEFDMGLLSPSDWKAQWIGDPAPAPKGVPARNGFHSQFAEKADAATWVTIDLAESREIDEVILFPARPYDHTPDTPGFDWPVKFRLVASDDATFKDPRVLADRTSKASARSAEPASFALTPTRARYVRLEVTELRKDTERGYALALAEMQVLSHDHPVSTGAKVTASDSIENGDWAAANLTDGDLVSHKPQGWPALPAPLMRKEFAVSGEVTRAMLYVTALGVYEARINGARVGDHQLAPEWTDYHTRVQYQAYDVTRLLKSGDNAIGVILGDGWYAGRLGMAQQFTPDKRPRAVYGRLPRLLAQLQIQHPDGSTQIVATDSTWTSSISGPIRSSDLLDGEVYDARFETPGFDAAGFTPSEEKPRWRPATVDDSIHVEIDAQANEPIRVIQTVKPVALHEPKPGVFVFDLGQNMPGHCRIHVKGKSGATLTLRHVEAINDDGTVYTDNLRGAPQIDRYTLAGNPNGETWEPRFTYHGFRFVEWAGDTEKPTIDSLEGVVITTDAPMAGLFECSSPMLNKLWSNILWTQHANTMSVPTDCPQRDERLGWMGDILAFAQTASFNKDLAAFYAKWLRDVRDAQADDGRFADISPHPYGKNKIFNGVPAWGDAGVFVPWVAYQNYADTRLLADQFDAARRWVDWIYSKNPDFIWRHERHNDYNDWLNGDTLISEGWPRKGGEVPRDVFATAFFARSTWIVAQMARALGKADEAAKYTDLYAKIKAAFIKEFVASDAKMPGDTQAGYALALGFDLLPPKRRAAAVDHLVRGIEAYHDHLSTGFHSTHHAMIELTKAGHADLAYKLANNTTFPSWGYSIENGSTTIWERWDGYVKGRGFQDPGMNSLNHWALGSVGEWMMRTIVGINPDPATPGWSHFELRPIPGGGLTHAKGSYHSCRGVIESGWRVDGTAVVYDFVVPANTTAAVALPRDGNVTESGRPLNEAPGVKIVFRPSGESGPLRFDLVAGRYSFRVAN
jgi:alpha-L-rhamnosidase